MAYSVGRYSVMQSVDVPNPFRKGFDNRIWAVCYERGRAYETRAQAEIKERRRAREAFYRANPHLRGKTFLETIRLY